MRIILASGSPRRKELLELIIPKFEIIESKAEEKLIEGLSVEEQATNLAYQKAKLVFSQTDGNRIVIGADTIVVKNGKIYGKPKDEKQAKEFIKELIEGDKAHYIITGLSILTEKDGQTKEYKTYDKVKVHLKNISDEEIEKWLQTGNAMDKAAAYGIQNEFCVFVEKVEGNYTTAVGLPTHKVYDIIIRNMGM